jgi:hypothetical protein
LLRTVGFLFLLFVMVVLGWGYWHMVTHATLNLSLYDVSLKTDRRAYGQVMKADIVFMNAAGAVLAAGAIREPYGVLSISHPEVGDCSRYEREASFSVEARREWQGCFEAMSRWLATWVGKIRYLTVTMNKCRIEKLPALPEKYGDSWWIWWIPSPHIGGKPYTSFSLTLKVDGLRCRAAESD